MIRPTRLVTHALTVVSLTLSTSLWMATTQESEAAVASNCMAFGGGITLPEGPSVENGVKSRIQEACTRFSGDIVSVKNAVHWWNGLLVQDFVGKGGDKPDGAIFYDVNAWHGAQGTKAFLLRGILLSEYWANPQWGPLRADVESAPASPPNAVTGKPTTGFVAKFGEMMDIFVYYNGRTKGTYVVSGVALTSYLNWGGPAGFLGYPESGGAGARPSGYDNGQTQGWFQNFEGGIMHSFSRRGLWFAYPVHGAIQAVYNTLPGTGSGSALGFPLSDEIIIRDLSNPTRTRGVYQVFQGGRVYYDGGVAVNSVYPDPHLTGTGSGTAFVLYENVIDSLPSDGLGGTGLAGGLGFPIGTQDDRNDPRAYFEYGYVDADGGAHPYGGSVKRPPMPANLRIPYAPNSGVNFTGGPHGEGKFPDTELISHANASGIDFGKNGQPFEVLAMAEGTVVFAEWSPYGFGNVIAIRSKQGGTIIMYCHLLSGSMSVRREPDKEDTPLKVGMYVAQGERIATTSNSGGYPGMLIHLHVELRSGTKGGHPMFGDPIPWQSDDVVLTNPTSGGPQYKIYEYLDLKEESKIRNYDGVAIRLAGSRTVDYIDSYYEDSMGTRQARLPIRGGTSLFSDSKCGLPSVKTCEDNTIDKDMTIFAKVESDLRGFGAAGDTIQSPLTAGGLESTDPEVVVTYDPSFLTLASPSLGEYRALVIIPLPELANGADPGYVAPLPTPIPSPVPTATPETPGPIPLSSATFNNGGFEEGSMAGWTTVNGTVDVDGSFVHSGSYSVHGSSGGNTSSGQSAVVFYRDFALAPYQFWVDGGRMLASSSGWFQNGDGEDYRMVLHFIDGAGNDIIAFDTGWRHDPGDSYVQVTDTNRAVQAGTAVIRYEVQIRRNSGSYTDVDVDDLTVQLNFVGP